MRDRIIRVTITFSDPSGTDVLERTYEMDSPSTFINSNDPQGKVPGSLWLKGLVRKYTDKVRKL